ncbi:conserved Plasmodium protein, unknown function [Plasmodium relictum]|uniref:Uncharacterized protein n=1 Tax=Plasmodium relictum TaxID=85471 RepID=A0A1J1H5C1_PLARL|nr:conserved Plasmodium protein, unknown function [Plasmodium relictum]CRG98793.1 conserved Plasmodium protein, unknown function [Plasmodium relictum]
MQFYQKLNNIPYFIKNKLNYELDNNNYFLILKKYSNCSKSLELKNVKIIVEKNSNKKNDVYHIIKNNNLENDYEQIKYNNLPVSKEKSKIELILNTIKSNKLDNVVNEILSIINENPKNRDIYINKNLMLSFYNILIKKKYYLNNLKNGIYDNCSINIFDYIHYNVNLNLRNYNLKNIYEVLNNLSKYIHKNKSNDVSNELVKNIFYFSFFSNFNKFYPKKNYNKLNNKTNINKKNLDNEIIEKKDINKEYNLYKCNLHKLKNYDQSNLENQNNIKGKDCLIKENISTDEASFMKEVNKNALSNNEIKKLSNKNYKYKDFDEETFAYLNSFIIFLSNHPSFINEKILYNISLLGSKIIEFNINFRLSLSYLSASLSIFDKQKTNKRNLFIYKKTNYDILYNILKECNKIFNKKSNELKNSYDQSKKENSEYDDSNKENLNVSKKQFKKCNTENHINIWNYSHIINVIKIIKIQNFLSRNYEDGEKCLEQFFNQLISYISIYQNDSIIISQNELNNFFSIYVNMSILLSELRNYKNIFLNITNFLNNSYNCIYVQYYNLHINMMINLLKGLYYQLLICSSLNSYKIYFKQIEKKILYEKKKNLEILNIKQKQIINLIILIQSVSNCILHPYREKNDLKLGKLITVVHYLHKTNKIFISFNINDIFRISILNYLIKSENMTYDKKYYENLSNHHILLLLNIYLYYKGLNMPFLNNCFNYLNTNDSNLFKNETEIIMFINFLIKFNEIKKSLKTKCQESIYNKNNVFNKKNNSNDITAVPNNEKNNIIEHTFLSTKHNVKDNKNISFNNIDISIKNAIDKIMNILFHLNKSKFSEFSLIQHNSFLCKKNSDINFEKFLLRNNNNKSSIINNPNFLTQYSLNTFFRVYENIYSFYENNNYIKERLLIFLNELIKCKRNYLHEENFFYILSAFLKTKNFNHDIFCSYYEFMKEKLQNIDMKYLFYIMKRIIEESSSLITNNENKINNNYSCNSNYLIFTNIINLSTKIILNDKNFMNNFTFIKEILHIYFQNYKKCCLFYKKFNYFILLYFNNFIKCDDLDENHLVIIINNIASFYYTIIKYSDQTKKISLNFTGPKNNKKLIYENINLEKMDCQKKNKEKKENINCSKYRKNNNLLLHINNNFENKCKNINEKNIEKIELFKNDFYNYDKENYNEQCLKNELIKQLNIFLYTLYNNKLKNKINNEVKLTNMNIIDIFVSLKNSKLREVNTMYILCKKYIMNIFAENNVKIEYQIKFFNSIIFLDYLKEADLLFRYLILKNKEKWKHIFYIHFLKLPANVFYIPNISTYILNFFSFLEYLDKESKKKIKKKIKFLIQMILKIFPNYNMNNLDKRNIFLLFVLLTFPDSPLNISSLSLECLKLFYINFIKNDLLSETNIVHSSSTHQNISEFITSFIRKNTEEYDIFNEKYVLSFNVDIVLNKK